MSIDRLRDPSIGAQHLLLVDHRGPFAVASPDGYQRLGRPAGGTITADHD
ncbi:MAG: hypothetical protein ACLQFR_14420 [Streptosporangiaceae bacterium]